jgi:hypothetical protein
MTEAEKKVRAYLAEIGRRGGITSRRELTKSHARQMVAIREAKRAALKAGKSWPPRNRKLLKLTWADARDFPSCAWALKRVAVLCDVTASQIIEEIKRLDPKEQIGVIRFAYQLDAERRLTGKELSALAERMVNTSDPAEKARVCEEIVRGFYGQRQHA